MVNGTLRKGMSQDTKRGSQKPKGSQPKESRLGYSLSSSTRPGPRPWETKQGQHQERCELFVREVQQSDAQYDFMVGFRGSCLQQVACDCVT